MCFTAQGCHSTSGAWPCAKSPDIHGETISISPHLLCMITIVFEFASFSTSRCTHQHTLCWMKPSAVISMPLSRNRHKRYVVCLPLKGSKLRGRSAARIVVHFSCTIRAWIAVASAATEYSTAKTEGLRTHQAQSSLTTMTVLARTVPTSLTCEYT